MISLRPELPWIGTPARRWEGPKRPPGKFAAAVQRTLRGVPVRRIEKPTADRWIRIGFAGGRALVAELATHGANLVLIDGDGTVLGAARNPRSSRERIVVGGAYRSVDLPRRMLNPFDADAAGIDRFLEASSDVDSIFELLRRRVFGIGTQGAMLVLEESRIMGKSPGSVLVERLAALERGEEDPIIRAEIDPLDAAEKGALDSTTVELLPWSPPGPAEDRHRWVRKRDAAATAGWYHEAVERAAELSRRLAALRSLMRAEITRMREAEQKVTADLSAFEDPGRHKRWGEALLAGVGRARRLGEALLVPDPYDPSGAEVPVPSSPGQSPQEAAEEHFRRYRKAQRGLERAERRAAWLSERRQKLEQIEWAHAEGSSAAAMEALEEAMRGAGMPVGLEPATRAGRAAARRGKPRLEGVRVFTSSDGMTVMVGRTGPANHRLTFKLAAPEDFWLHAQGCPGAHVVVRNDRRRRRPPDETLREAAALAAWFSDSRAQEFADVQWTRRKYVRRPRGSAPGTVILKRFETIRIRPGVPPSMGDADGDPRHER
jgi:predicted ribosome quality control (RQC) complex YloA/Tae2 family protein